MVEQVISYRTSDGRLFPDKLKAEEHEDEVRIGSKVKDMLSKWSIPEQLIDYFRVYLVRYRKEILEALK